MLVITSAEWNFFSQFSTKCVDSSPRKLLRFFCDMSLNTVLGFQLSAFYKTGALEAYTQTNESQLWGRQLLGSGDYH